MNTALNRVMVCVLTNKSGGSVAQGDVVVVDPSTAAAFTTTTTGALVNASVGVVVEPNGIVSNAAGLVAFSGYVPKINLSGSASLGDFFKTHTVAKQAVGHASPVVGGDFGEVLGTGTTPAALLWGLVDKGAGAAGAPTTSEYITSAADAGLSAEVVIPGLAGSPDIAGAGGAGVSYEFDSGVSPFTWDGAVGSEDVDTTIKSHLCLTYAGNTARYGKVAWTPAGDLDIRVKISLGPLATATGNSTAYNAGVQFIVFATADEFGMAFGYQNNGVRFEANGFSRISASWAQRGVLLGCGGNNVAYLRIVRNGSNVWSYYYSMDGLNWMLIGSHTQAATVTHFGLKFENGASSSLSVGCDWIRASV